MRGRISSEEKVRGQKFLGRKSRFKKNRGWGRIAVCRELFTPLEIHTSATEGYRSYGRFVLESVNVKRTKFMEFIESLVPLLREQVLHPQILKIYKFL